MSSGDPANLIVSDIVANEPRIDETAIAEMKAEQERQTEQPQTPENQPPQTPGTVSESFNPDIHEVDSLGNPRLTIGGKYRRKRGNGARKNVAEIPTAPVNPMPNVNRYKASATMIAGLMFTTGQAAFGKAWKPSDDEKAGIEEAFATYFAAKGFDDIPPGLALILAIGMDAGTRLATDPETKERLVLMGVLRGTPKPKPVENVAAVKPVEPPKAEPVTPAAPQSPFFRQSA